MAQSPRLKRNPFSDLINDNRKWHEIWWDNIWSIDKTDIVPSIIFSSGAAYYFFIIGAFTMFSISTAGIGLGVLAVGAIGYFLLIYSKTYL